VSALAGFVDKGCVPLNLRNARVHHSSLFDIRLQRR